jgi:hypothetical protein
MTYMGTTLSGRSCATCQQLLKYTTPLWRCECPGLWRSDLNLMVGMETLPQAWQEGDMTLGGSRPLTPSEEETPAEPG